MIKWLQREWVCHVAKGELGKGVASKYWLDVGVKAPFPASWCGAFCLWCFHRARVAKDVNWVIEKGFLYKYPQTKTPRKGDVAYFSALQHQAMIVKVDGTTISLINGNGNGGEVTVGTVQLSKITACYDVIGS